MDNKVDKLIKAKERIDKLKSSETLLFKIFDCCIDYDNNAVSNTECVMNIINTIKNNDIFKNYVKETENYEN